MVEEFVNDVGSYTMLAFEQVRVRYRFVSRAGKVTQADVPEAVWRRMAARARSRGEGKGDGFELQRAA